MKYKGSEYSIAVGIGASIVIAAMMFVMYKYYVASVCDTYEYMLKTNFDGLAQASYAVLSAPYSSHLIIDLPFSFYVSLDDKGNLMITAKGRCVKQTTGGEKDVASYVRKLNVKTRRSSSSGSKLCLENLEGALKLC